MRYLTSSSGRRVDRRWLAALATFGALLLVCPLGAVGVVGASAGAPGAAICGFGLAFVCLMGGAVASWVLLFRVAKRLETALERLDDDDTAGAVEMAQSGMLLAFRGDFRTKGFHVLGLCAERNGDFDDAADLFGHALAAMPALAAPIRKRRATVLIEAHRALACSAAGRHDAARAALDAADRSVGAEKGAADLLLDDGDWGLGSISLNSVLAGLEHRRDPEALLQLARALVARNRGEIREAIALLEADSARLSQGLLDRERSLAQQLGADCRARLDPAYRAPSPPTAHDPSNAWATSVLGTA